MNTIVQKLSEHQSSTPSKWREEAEFRVANKSWLRYSQHIAMLMLGRMEELGLTQKLLAEKMGCSQQYVSKILKGRENLSIETLCKIEMALELSLLPQMEEVY
jgi:ribosome-binding protein aMBF1 (putative translation factor)